MAAMGAMLLPMLMTAQFDRTRPPAPGPAPIVQIGDHTTSVLPNGMRLIVVEDHKLPLVSVQVRFDVPPIVQGEKAGYVDLFGELLMTGAGDRSKADIDREVDAIGASLFTSNDGLFASALKKNLLPLMAIIGDVVKNPTFPEKELSSALVRAKAMVQQRQDDPEAVAETVGRAMMFGRTHPYGEVTTERTLSRIQRPLMEAYHRHFFRPENGYLVFVGDITEKEAKELAKSHFGKWKPKASSVSTDEHGRTVVEGLGFVIPLKNPSVPGRVRKVYVVDRPQAAQSVIRVMFPLPLVPKDLRAQQAQVMNTILGGGIFNARLMQNLREKHGFTYGCYSSLDVDRHNSSFVATASVRTEVTDSAVTEILAEMEGMRSAPVAPAELDLARSSMMGGFGRSLEDPRTIARFALNTKLNDLPTDHYATYLTRLAVITTQQVQDAASAFLYPDQAVILVVGDWARIKDGLAKFAPDGEVVQLTVDAEPWQEVLTPVPGRTAEQVVETYLHAIGGRERIAPLRHLEWVLLAEQHGQPTERSEWFAPGQYRMRQKRNGALTEEIIFDGSRVLYSDGENSGELTDAGHEMVLHRGRPIPEMAYGEVLEQRRLLGSTDINGHAAYKLALTLRSGTTFYQYFDVESGLKVREIQDQYMNGRAYQQVVDYFDWQPIAGVLFPHRTVAHGGVAGTVVSKLTAPKVGQAMPPAHFAVVIPEVPDLPVSPEMLPPEYTPRTDE